MLCQFCAGRRLVLTCFLSGALALIDVNLGLPSQEVLSCFCVTGYGQGGVHNSVFKCSDAPVSCLVSGLGERVVFCLQVM